MNYKFKVSLFFLLVTIIFSSCNRTPEPKQTPTEKTEQDNHDPEVFLPESGKTPEATLRAYFYYKDRGNMKQVRTLVAKDYISQIPNENTQGMSARAQSLRDIIIDHKTVKNEEAILYCRNWFSRATKARGGRPSVFRMVKEDGSWKVDVKGSFQRTMKISKGKDDYGFYDGTEKWWE